MDSPEVRITPLALINMIIPAVDTFKRECLGFLDGERPTGDRNHFLITNAVGVHAHVRKNIEVRQSKRSERRLKLFFEDASHIFRPLGTFHSHAEWGSLEGSPKMSTGDIEDMLKHRWDLELIIVISSLATHRKPWRHMKDGSIRGSLSKYHFHITAYTLCEDEEGEKKPHRLTIVAPAALRLLNATPDDKNTATK